MKVLNIIEIYEEVLQGKRHAFPRSTWEDAGNSVKVLKYLIEEKLKWSKEQVRENFSLSLLKQYKLNGLVSICFGGSPYEALNAAYPDEYLFWELRNTPRSSWTLETGRQATKWLIDEKLKWSDEEVCNNLNQRVFGKNGLSGMLQSCFEGSTFEALNVAYPNKYKPWDLASTPKMYWTLETGIQATKWLIEEKLKWTKDEVCTNLRKDTFVEHGLRGMLKQCFNHSPYSAIEAAYPGTYKPWEMYRIPKTPWTEDRCIDAIKWLVNKEMEGSPRKAICCLNKKVFRANGLSDMLERHFNNNIEHAINTVYCLETTVA